MFMNDHRSQGGQKREEEEEKKKGRARSSRALFLFLFLSVSSLSAFYSPYSNLQFTKPLGVFLKCYLPSQFFCSKAFRNFLSFTEYFTQHLRVATISFLTISQAHISSCSALQLMFQKSQTSFIFFRYTMQLLLIFTVPNF